MFEVGDLVWIHLSKKHFQSGRASKLHPCSNGPFKIVAKINDNAYKVDLPISYSVSDTFNVDYLSPYVQLNDTFDSRMSRFEDGENDATHATVDRLCQNNATRTG